MKIVFEQIASARSYIIQFHPCIQYTFIHVIQISVTEIWSLQIKWNVKKTKTSILFIQRFNFDYTCVLNDVWL